MFRKVSQAAEQAATNVSRRHFLGRIGRGAGVAAAAFAGLLVHASPAWAGRKKTRMCSVFSAAVQCQGLPVGSPCEGTQGGSVVEGKCSGPKISPGVYNCNDCKTKGKPSKDDGGRG